MGERMSNQIIIYNLSHFQTDPIMRFLYTVAVLLFVVTTMPAQVAFPPSQPVNGNFNRPLPGEILDISPPGFCWWRAAPRGEISYRLRIENESGESVYQSELLSDPVHVPGE